MHHKMIEGYAHYATVEDLVTSSASAPEASPVSTISPATPVSALSVASFVGGVLTYHNGC